MRSARRAAIRSAERLPCRQFACRDFSRPSGVRGPVDAPPCILHRVYLPLLLLHIAGARHSAPALVFALQRGDFVGSPLHHGPLRLSRLGTSTSVLSRGFIVGSADSCSACATEPLDASPYRPASGPGLPTVPPGHVPSQQARSRERVHHPPAAICSASGYRPHPDSGPVDHPIRRREVPRELPARPRSLHSPMVVPPSSSMRRTPARFNTADARSNSAGSGSASISGDSAGRAHLQNLQNRVLMVL